MQVSAYQRARSELESLIRDSAESLGYRTEGKDASVSFSREFGDMSSSIALRLAKELKRDAKSVAKEISAKMKAPDYVETITSENGFINFHLNRQRFSDMVLQPEAPRKAKGGGKIIIEYPSVNPNKPWHIGHLRNALLGNAVSNIYIKIGYNVEREDYIDDLGLQMAESTWWHITKGSKPEGKFDHWIGEQYVKANEHLDDPGAREAVKSVMALMSQDGTYESEMLHRLAIECVNAQRETATNFGVSHNVLIWESDIVNAALLEKSMKILEKHDFVKKPKEGDYANCIIVDFKEIKDLPKEFKDLKESAKVLIRSDGTPTYVAKDIAFHMWKFGIIEDHFKYSKMLDQKNGEALYTTGKDGSHMEFGGAQTAINIIDMRQDQPQALIRLIFRAMGKEKEAENLRHLSYGKVDLKSGTLSGRAGTWQGYSADDLLRETQHKARELIGANTKIGAADIEKVSQSVALAAIKFEFLRISPEKLITFSWEDALNFQGNSGPYAQYMHARATRIIEEAEKRGIPTESAKMPKISDKEFALVKLLLRQDEAVEKAAKELKPNVITEYINELAYAFGTFYESSRVLNADTKEEKAFRIKLTREFRGAMKTMLELLGIEALESM